MNGSWNFLPRWKKKLPIYIIHYALRARKLVSKAGFSGWLKFFCKTVHVLSRATVCTAVCVCALYPREIAWFVLLSSIPRAPSSLSLHFLQPLLERSLRKRGPLKLHGSWDFSRYFFFFLFSKIARAIIRHRKRVINKRSIDIYRNVNWTSVDRDVFPSHSLSLLEYRRDNWNFQFWKKKTTVS